MEVDGNSSGKGAVGQAAGVRQQSEQGSEGGKKGKRGRANDGGKGTWV